MSPIIVIDAKNSSEECYFSDQGQWCESVERFLEIFWGKVYNFSKKVEKISKVNKKVFEKKKLNFNPLTLLRTPGGQRSLDPTLKTTVY